MLRCPDLLRAPLVREVAVVALDDRHAAHRHQTADLRLNPQLRQPVTDCRVVLQMSGVLVRLHEVHDVFIAPHGHQVAACTNTVQVQPHRAQIPAVVLFANEAIRGHPNVLEERLVRAILPVGRTARSLWIVLDRPERANRDPRCVHRDHEDRNPGVALRLGVGPRHQVDVRRSVSAGRVHLLAVDDVFIPVTDRAALQAGQVGATLRLRKAEAERNLAADQPLDIRILLLLGASRQNHRRAATGAAHGYADARELLLDDVLVNSAAALAAVLDRPANREPPVIADLLVELLPFRPAAPLVIQAAHHFGSDLAGDKILDLSSERFLSFGVSKFHCLPPSYA